MSYSSLYNLIVASFCFCQTIQPLSTYHLNHICQCSYQWHEERQRLYKILPNTRRMVFLDLIEYKQIDTPSQIGPGLMMQ